MNRYNATVPLALGLVASLAGCDDGPMPEPSPFPDTAVADFVFPDDSTILLNTYLGRIIVSTNEGDTWSTHGREPFVQLVRGAGGSVWGVYSAVFLNKDSIAQSSLEPPSVVGISRDGGETFTRIDLDDYSLHFGKLIELDDADPLFLSRKELYRFTPASGGVQATVESVSGPVPTEFLGEDVTDAIMCRGALFSTTIGLDHPTGETHLRIWRLHEGEAGWQLQFEVVTFDSPYLLSFTCGAGEDLWVASDEGLVMHYDADVQGWREVVELKEVLPAHFLWITSSAVHEGALYVITRGLLHEISPSGEVRQFANRNMGLLKVDLFGNLWGSDGTGLHRWDDAGDWVQVWPVPEAGTP